MTEGEEFKDQQVVDLRARSLDKMGKDEERGGHQWGLAPY